MRRAYEEIFVNARTYMYTENSIVNNDGKHVKFITSREFNMFFRKMISVVFFVQ